MFEITRSKKLPYTSDFIQYGLNKAKELRVTVWNRSGSIIGTLLCVAIPTAAFVNAQGWDIARAILVLILTPAFVCAGLAIINQIFMVPKNRNNRSLTRLLEILDPYRLALEQRRLHKDLDTTTAQLLEAASFHWANIQRELATGIWNEPNLSPVLEETKRDALRAADITMYEALTLSLRCFAPAGHKRNPAEEIVEDLKDLNLEAALDGFKQVLKGEKAYRSPDAVQVVPLVQDLTSKLKKLSEQIWEITSSDKNKIHQRIASDAPGASIDHVLRQMRELETAKQELDNGVEDRLYH